MLWEQPDVFELVHINEPSAVESSAYLLQLDSVHGVNAAQRSMFL